MKERVPFWVLSLLGIVDTIFAALVLPDTNFLVLAPGCILQLLGALVLGFGDRLPAIAGTVPFAVGTLLLVSGPAWREMYAQSALLWMPVATAIVSANLVRLAKQPSQFLIGAAGLVCWVISAAVIMSFDGVSAITTILLASAPILAGSCISLFIRLRRVQQDQLERARQDRAAVEAEVRQDERDQLAEELHDTVTHEVTLLVMQANVIATTTSETTTREAAATMGEQGNRALQDLREFVRVLRQDPLSSKDARAQRDAGLEYVELPLAEMRRLVQESRKVTSNIEFVTSGSPIEVSIVIARTLVRLTQEGLTNLHKHSTGTRAVLSLAVVDDSIHFELRNQMSSGNGLARFGSASGLTALRRRVELLGGVLQTESADDGDFVLFARLPVGRLPLQEEIP